MRWPLHSNVTSRDAGAGGGGGGSGANLPPPNLEAVGARPPTLNCQCHSFSFVFVFARELGSLPPKIVGQIRRVFIFLGRDYLGPRETFTPPNFKVVPASLVTSGEVGYDRIASVRIAHVRNKLFCKQMNRHEAQGTKASISHRTRSPRNSYSRERQHMTRVSRGGLWTDLPGSESEQRHLVAAGQLHHRELRSGRHGAELKQKTWCGLKHIGQTGVSVKPAAASGCHQRHFTRHANHVKEVYIHRCARRAGYSAGCLRAPSRITAARLF